MCDFEPVEFPNYEILSLRLHLSCNLSQNVPEIMTNQNQSKEGGLVDSLGRTWSPHAQTLNTTLIGHM